MDPPGSCLDADCLDDVSSIDPKKERSISGSAVGTRPSGALFLLVASLVIQTFVIIAHGFTHSTTAWLLGYTATPFTIVRDDPITVRGWDEGVPRDRLFPSPGHLAEAAIGGMPPPMHTVLVVVSLLLIARLTYLGRWRNEHRALARAAGVSSPDACRWSRRECPSADVIPAHADARHTRSVMRCPKGPEAGRASLTDDAGMADFLSACTGLQLDERPRHGTGRIAR